MLKKLKLLKIGGMCTVLNFVPELSVKFGLAALKTLKLNRILGAGRGNRTPMELLPTDFESAASASSAIPALQFPLTTRHLQPSIA